MHYHDALLGSIIESPRNDLSDIGDIPWRSIVPQGQIRDRDRPTATTHTTAATGGTMCRR